VAAASGSMNRLNMITSDLEILSLKPAVAEWLGKIRHVALDMDGTIYSGKTLFKTTAPFLASLRELGIGYTFLTNNPSKSKQIYLEHLLGMGIKATVEELYTSSQATIEFLQQNHPQCKRLFVLGTPSMCDEFSRAGFELLPDSPSAEPDAVVVGFDLTLTYARLCRAAWWIQQGKLYLATNPDRVCPTDQPTVLPDCGAICAALDCATGRKPDTVMGKPDPAMLTGILQRHQLKPDELAMVGDRLYTDITMAHRAGTLGVLVLTGEATLEQAKAHKPMPDLVTPSLGEFGELLKSANKRRLAN